MLKNNKALCVIILTTIFLQINAQSLKELQKLKDQYGQSSNNQQGITGNSQMEFESRLGSPNMTSIRTDMNEKTALQPSDMETYFFGYDFFTLRDSIALWDNLPIPREYILGPGDELIVSLWGETQLRSSYIISREGKIYDDKVGLLNVSGKTIEEVKKYLTLQYGRIYATLNGQAPTTYIDISLGELKSINVNFVGEVKYPGVYTLHPFSNVITGLIQAGGVDTTGSLRTIKIIRNNKDYETIDFYDYLLEGKISNSIQLRDQDIVLVPVRLSTVVIDSAVRKPGVYEAREDESIKKLINFAGGLSSKASTNIGLKRVMPIELRDSSQSVQSSYYINYNNSGSTIAQDGDSISVMKIFDSLNRVEVIGQVKRPGVYNYFPGMNLNDLIELSGGFNDSTFVKSIYKRQSQIVRRNPDSRYETVIQIDIRDLLNNGIGERIELQNLDRFVVHANLNYFEKKNVQIQGEVNVPGFYPLTSDSEPLLSILERSGGLTAKALKNGISIYRDKIYFDYGANSLPGKIRVAWLNESIIMMPGDSIVVKESTKTVIVSGEVYNPGLIEFSPGKRLGYYLNSAGGIKEDANKNGIMIVYANGIVKPKKWYSRPTISEGSTIVVNRKKPEEPFNITEFASNWTSIISSMVTVIVLNEQLKNQ